MDEFDRIKVIGKGSFGEVWLSKHKRDQKQYVLKKINLQRASRKERTSAEQEASLLQQLKHPNIVSYKQSFETPDGQLYIAMQFCEGGDLYTKLKDQKGSMLGERQVVEWFVQIAMALQYMHERHILHRDLKTQNIFLTKSKIIKLGDLGIARVLEAATDMATTLIGTPYYMSPEIFSNKPYNHKSDVWSLGCCLYEMTTLKHAFNAKDMNSLVYKILKGKLPPMPRQYSPELLNMMRCMLHQDPVQRPSINRLLRDPYIRRNIAIFLEDTRRGAGRRSSAAGRRLVSAGPGRASSAAVADSGVSGRSSEAASARVKPLPGPPDADAESSRKSVVSPSPAVQQPSRSQPQRISVSESHDSPKAINRPASRSSQGRGHSACQQPKDHNSVNPAVPSQESAQGPLGDGKDSVEPAGVRAETEEKGQCKATPMPKAERSEGLPHKREPLVQQNRHQQRERESTDSASSFNSEGVPIDDTPRSMPNTSARHRRRAERASSAMEGPPSARNIKLRKVPEKADSDHRRSKDKTSSSRAKRQRQPSLQDSSSSCDEATPTPVVSTKEREKRRENKEMDNLITLLDHTLKMNIEVEKSDEEETMEDPVAHVQPSTPSSQAGQRQQTEKDLRPPSSQKTQAEYQPRGRRSPPLPSVETLASTSRLMGRIRLLHKDCVQGVGYSDLKKAYDILDHIDEEEVEPKLMALLGKEKFDKFVIKIWQLKFCEESFFMC